MWVLYALSALLLGGNADWQDDFARQPEMLRPALEVRYTDASRTAFEIDAEAYDLRGELRKPNRLLYAESGNIMLYFNLRDVFGNEYSTQNSEVSTRINLYRRGPYFSEVHWFDWEATDDKGEAAPLKGEVVLYCYPDRIRGAITWHAEGRFPLESVTVVTGNNLTLPATPMQTGDMQTFTFPLFGTQDPLPESALTTLDAAQSLRFDGERGCYTIGTVNRGGFQGHFYHHPNAYEQATFTVTNDSQPRTVYICHETVEGPAGLVEGGVLLDDKGHPMPIVVQISKNFAGEKEEPFYNPEDTPFSETWFPLHLLPNETVTLSSLHLYQNWGRHPVKQFSSLGAWADYFHSSTGVTETTCYVPFKFNALDGIDIADLRAISQPAYWLNQPQHDNVAGHRILRYKTAAGWQYLVYQRTRYLSTGPNWMHVLFEYLSSDGAVKVSYETFELPQQDELRNFFRMTCQLQAPLAFEDAATEWRMLEIGTRVQGLRYTHAAASGLDPVPLDAAGNAVSGHVLPESNAWMALYGDPKGSNATILREWLALSSAQSLAPALGVEREADGNTSMWIGLQGEALEMPKGSMLRIDGFFLPYGEVDSTSPAVRETLAYGEHAPRVTEVTVGAKVSDFPTQITAVENVAEFTIEGGRDVVPVLITGLTDYRWPRLFRKSENGLRTVSHSGVTPLDGIEVFAEAGGKFGAVFLVHSDGTPQTLRATAGQELPPPQRIQMAAVPPKEGQAVHAVSINTAWLESPLTLRYPVELESDRLDYSDDATKVADPPSSKLAGLWRADMDAQWFEWDFADKTLGGRLTPYEHDIELQAWFENRSGGALTMKSAMALDTAGSIFDTARGARHWFLEEGEWRAWEGDEHRAAAAAITSADGAWVVAIAWERRPGLPIFNPANGLHFAPAWPECPPQRRVHLRGRLYVMEGAMSDLAARIRREFPAEAAEQDRS